MTMDNWKVKIATIWIGQSVSLLTSSVLQMALIWYITATTGSAIMVTTATIAGFLPHAFLGTFAGVFVDRYSKKKILISADLFISAVSLILAIVALKGDLPVWLIIVILFFRSLGTAFHEPTAQSIIPMFVPKENITQCSGYVQAFDSVSLIISPTIAILLYEIWPMSSIIFLDVIGAVIAVSMIFVVKFPKQEFSDKKNQPIKIIAETKDGIRIMSQYQGILGLMIIGFLYTMVYSPIGSLYPHITMNYFNGTTAQSGFVEIIFSVGSLVGALVLGVFGAKISKSLGLIGSICLYGSGIFVIGMLSPESYWIFVAISFVVGFSTPFYHGITRSIFQVTIPEEYLGRTFALSQSSRRLAMPIGLLVGGFFSDAIGVNVLYIVFGIMAVILAGLLMILPSFKNFRKF